MSEQLSKKYTNEEITVLWKPRLCIHSEKCWRGLPSVFKPREKPWIQVEGATTQEIINQVDKCPSGALSWIFNDDELNEQTDSMNTEEKEETIVEVMPNGPLMVYGNKTIKLASGEKESTHDVKAFCRCGQSSNKPYCDGTHKKAGFEG